MRTAQISVRFEPSVDFELDRFATRADIQTMGRYLIAWMLLSQVTLVVWLFSVMLIAR